MTGGGTLVLGVGNLLWADEGVGPRLVEALRRRPDLPDVELVDGGTQGLYLLPLVTAATRLLLLDAVDLGRPPGTVVVLEGPDIDSRCSARPLSLHELNVRDLLAAAALVDWTPKAVALVGIQISDSETWGSGLTPAVAAAIPEAIARIHDILDRWDRHH